VRGVRDGVVVKAKPIKLAGIERLVELLGGKMLEYESSGETYMHFLNEALKEGKTQEEAEELALAAEAEEEAEVWNKFKDAVEFTATDLFHEHDLEVERCEEDGSYRVYPRTSWKATADHIRQTINGVGYFPFAGLRTFLDSGPYTPREAVVGHLHWIKDWPDVYEGTKAWGMVERRMR